MTFYVARPVCVEARQFTDKPGGLASELVAWIEEEGKTAYYAPENVVIAITSPEGIRHVAVGDWIVKGIYGDFYSYNPDLFAASYNPLKVSSKEKG